MDHLATLSKIERHIQAALLRHTAKECRVCCMAVELINELISDDGLDAALATYRAERAKAGRAGEPQCSAHERRDECWQRVVGPGPREST
jgi:hypothetical protein